jgi:hypothetical protein
VLFQFIDTLKAHRAHETGLMSLYDEKETDITVRKQNRQAILFR